MAPNMSGPRSPASLAEAARLVVMSSRESELWGGSIESS